MLGLPSLGVRTIVISQGIQALVLASENQELEKFKKKKKKKKENLKRVGKARENLRNPTPLDPDGEILQSRQ